jgi:hypothetical protein
MLDNPAADREIWLEASAHALPDSVVTSTLCRPCRITDDVSRRDLEPTLSDCAFASVVPSGARDATLPVQPRTKTGD